MADLANSGTRKQQIGNTSMNVRGWLTQFPSLVKSVPYLYDLLVCD